MKKLLILLLMILGFNSYAQEKILFVLTSHEDLGNTGRKTGFYLSEAAHPWQVLSEAGYEIDFVSPKGGKAPVDGFDLEDPISKSFWENKSIQQKLNNTKTPLQVNARDYIAIHYVGGHGSMWDLPHDKTLQQIATSIYEADGYVSAVCHGPAGLINIKLSNGEYLVKGRVVSMFTNEEEEAVKLTKEVPFLLEDELKKRGAITKKSANFQSHVEVDGHLITGQNPASATELAKRLLAVLKPEQ